METKICSKCKTERPIEDFYFKCKSKGTRIAVCKQCCKKRDAERYKKLKDSILFRKKLKRE